MKLFYVLPVSNKTFDPIAYRNVLLCFRVKKSLGWTAIHVTDEPDHNVVSKSVAALCVEKVHDLPKVLPELWEVK